MNFARVLYTTDQIAQLMGVTTMTIFRWRKEKGMPCIKEGRAIKFDITQIERWLEENEIRVKYSRR